LATEWSRIVGEHGRMVFQTAFRVLGNTADAEDVAQEVFLEVVSRTPGHQVQSWGGYLRKLAVFRALDRRRRRTDDVPLEAEGLLAATASPHDEAVRRELAEGLRSLIAALPEREGAVFVLRYFERLTNPQIAEVLGISTGAVAAAIHKVRAKLEAAVTQNSLGEMR
jgi:RNA polymerase sigma-70 factor, ECF subfamily